MKAQVELARERAEQVRDLGLRRGVERRQRLVEHDHRRPRGERLGDRDPLALPAGKLVRVAARAPASESDLVEQLRNSGRPGPHAARGRACSRFRSICSPTRRRGLSEEKGFWKTSWSRASSRGQAPRVSGLTSGPRSESCRKRARPCRPRPAQASTCRSRTRRRGRRFDRARPRRSHRRRPAPARRRGARTRRQRSRARRAHGRSGSTGQAGVRPLTGASARTSSGVSSAYRQRVEGAAGRNPTGRGRRASDRDELGLSSAPDAAARRAARACTGAAAGRARRHGRLPRRSGPRRTATRSAIAERTPRSCEMRTIARPNSRRSRSSRRMMPACTVTSRGGGRLVGDEQGRPAHERDGDRDRWRITGELVRGAHRALGIRDPDLPQ